MIMSQSSSYGKLTTASTLVSVPHLALWRRTTLTCFFFNDTATTEIYTLSLHDALPIWGLASAEELVHDLGAGGDDGAEFAAVDDLGGAGGGVPDEAGDLLDGDSLVAHQADEGGAQLARGPAVPDAGLGTDPFEHLADVARVQRGAQLVREHQPGVLPVLPGREPFAGLGVRP